MSMEQPAETGGTGTPHAVPVPSPLPSAFPRFLFLSGFNLFHRAIRSFFIRVHSVCDPSVVENSPFAPFRGGSIAPARARAYLHDSGRHSTSPHQGPLNLKDALSADAEPAERRPSPAWGKEARFRPLRALPQPKVGSGFFHAFRRI